MDNFNIGYLFLALLTLASWGCLFPIFKLLFSDFRGAKIAAAMIAVLVVTTSAFNVHNAIASKQPVLIAEVDSEVLLREFIYSEARGSRPMEDLDKITAIYGRAFDLTINNLATENAWIVIPKNAAVIGVGVRFDVTSLVRKRLEDTLQLIGYEYLPPATPAAALEGQDND